MKSPATNPILRLAQRANKDFYATHYRYAPAGAGKTIHSDELLAFFKLPYLVDDWMPTGEYLANDTLYLTQAVYEDLDLAGHVGEFDIYTLDEALELIKKATIS